MRDARREEEEWEGDVTGERTLHEARCKQHIGNILATH